MKQTWLVVALVCALGSLAWAQGKAASDGGRRPKQAAADAAAPVEVRTSVSRTAVWVGDRVTYLVEIQSGREVDILLDDLAAERLQTNGLEILSVEIENDTTVPDRSIHRVRYSLASYAIGAPLLTIDEIPVRFSVRRPGQRPEDVVPSGEVLVPPLALALRSTIPNSDRAVAIRDLRDVKSLPLRIRLAQPIGLGLVILAVAPVAVWGGDLIRRARRSRPQRRRRQTRKQLRASLEAIKALDVSSEAAQREAYAQLDLWIRDFLQHRTGSPAGALTPAEIPVAITVPHRLPVDQIRDLLVECELAKYSPEPIAADRWRATLEVTEQSLAP